MLGIMKRTTLTSDSTELISRMQSRSLKGRLSNGLMTVSIRAKSECMPSVL